MDETQLLSYLNGNLSEDEAKEVEDWVAESEDHRRLLKHIYYTSRLSRCAAAYEQADVESALNNFRKRVAVEEKPQVSLLNPVAPRSSWWKRYGLAAAAFFSGLVLASGVLLSVYESTAVSTFQASTLPGQRARVILPDGTGVWLNSSTEVVYKSGGLWSKREACLKGEAYFEVKKNLIRPFVVNSYGVLTQVLGTKFNVRARRDERQVVTTLFQGAVQMHMGTEDEEGIRLSPGQTLCVDKETKQSDLYIFNHPEDVLLWIKGELHFENKPLGDIMDCLSKVYNVKVSFQDVRLKNERFTCSFKTDASLEKVLSILALTRHFQYEILENQVMIRSQE